MQNKFTIYITNSWKRFKEDDLKRLNWETVFFALSLLFIIPLAASDIGFMLRDEMATDFNVSHIFFYLSCFCIPYFILYSILEFKYFNNENANYKKHISIPFIKLCIGSISLACSLTSIFLLRSIIVFIKNIPFDKEWLFILWLSMTLLLLFYGIRGIIRSIKKLQKYKEEEYRLKNYEIIRKI